MIKSAMEIPENYLADYEKIQPCYTRLIQSI